MPLIPRDEGFFTLFNQLAAKMKVAADLLRSMFMAMDRLPHFVAEIKKVEHEADAVIHEVSKRLDRTFITPLDREDIYRLAQELDNVTDLIDGTARRAAMFHLRDSRPHAVELAEILHAAVNELEASVRQVKDRRSVAGHTLAVKKFEEAGDTAYAQAIGDLFQGTPDPIDVIKDPQLQTNNIVVPLEGVGENMKLTVSSPIQVHGVAKVAAKRGPDLGEHNNEVLNELGLDTREIERLRAGGVIGKPIAPAKAA